MHTFFNRTLILIFINYILFASVRNENKFQTSFVSMRDGIKLAVDYYFDNDSNEKYPVILEMTPYSRKNDGYNFRNEADFWYKNGYVFVVADIRGAGDSEGELEFLTHDGEDGYDLIEWISKQPWSNGKIGMRGSSYSGTNQLYIAAKQPRSLKCITPTATVGRPFESPPFINGAFVLFWALDWFGRQAKTKYRFSNFINNQSAWLNYRPLKTIDYFASGKELPLYRTFIEHVTLDSYWKELLLTETLIYSNINIPSLSFTGWFDGALSGTVMHFENFRKFSSNKNDRFIFIGPYAHENAPEGGYSHFDGKPMKKVGDVDIQDNAFIPGINITKDFYDWCLKNKTRPDWKNENMYITGTNKWLNGDNLFNTNTKESFLYLSSSTKANGLYGDGKLSFDFPKFENKDVFSYNPNQPVRSDEKNNFFYPIDINFYLNRSDVLVYTSDVLKSPLTMFGDVEIELTISATTKDTDFMAFLMDVYEDGRSIRMGAEPCSTLRTRYREGFEKEILMEENAKYNIKIRINQIGHTFPTGHKIRLAITSSFFPLISANPNTGNPIQTDTDKPIISNQTIYYGKPTNKIFSRIKFMTWSMKNSSIILNQNQFIIIFLNIMVFLNKNI